MLGFQHRSAPGLSPGEPASDADDRKPVPVPRGAGLLIALGTLCPFAPEKVTGRWVGAGFPKERMLQRGVHQQTPKV